MNSGFVADLSEAGAIRLFHTERDGERAERSPASPRAGLPSGPTPSRNCGAVHAERMTAPATAKCRSLRLIRKTQTPRPRHSDKRHPVKSGVKDHFDGLSE